MVSPFILDGGSDDASLVTLSSMHTYMKRINEAVNHEISNCYSYNKHNPHSDTKKHLETALMANTIFRNWSRRDESGICFIHAYCWRWEHEETGCNGVCLPRGFEQIMTDSVNPSASDVISIRVRCSVFNEREKKLTYRHPTVLIIQVIKVLYELAGISSRPIKVEKDYVGVLDENNYFFASLSLLDRVVQRFIRVYPWAYLNIIIEDTGPHYRWPSELAIFLHVLSQMTRLPKYMPQTLKVIIAGGNELTAGIWESFEHMRGKEFKKRQKHSDSLKPEEKEAILRDETLQLEWHERSRKHPEDEMPQGKQWVPWGGEDQEMFLYTWTR
jgi:hypothetical protein